MAKIDDVPKEGAYSSSIRKTLLLGKDGINRATASNPVPTDTVISGDINVDNTSIGLSGILGKASGTNADFITAYASAATITCTTLPSGVTAIKADDVVSITEIGTTGKVLFTYTRDDVTIVATGTDPTTLTVSGTGFTNFVATSTFIVYTNIPQTRGDKVDLIEVAGTATNVNGGNRDAGTQTVTLADDDLAVTGITDKTQMSQITDGTTEVDVITTINSAKTDLSSVAGTVTEVNAGNVSAGTQRVTIATDDINQAAINVSTTTMADWDNTAGDGAKVSGDTAHDAADAGEPVGIGGVAASAQRVAVAVGDRVKAVFNLFGELVIAGYTWATNSIRTEEIDPLDEHHMEDELIDDTDITAATHYYPSAIGISMGPYNNLSCHYGIADPDGSIELITQAKNDDSTDWVDINASGKELSDNTVGNTSFIAVNETVTGIIAHNDLHVRDVRYKIVTSGATNAIQLHIKRTAL